MQKVVHKNSYKAQLIEELVARTEGELKGLFGKGQTFVSHLGEILPNHEDEDYLVFVSANGRVFEDFTPLDEEGKVITHISGLPIQLQS